MDGLLTDRKLLDYFHTTQWVKSHGTLSFGPGGLRETYGMIQYGSLNRDCNSTHSHIFYMDGLLTDRKLLDYFHTTQWVKSHGTLSFGPGGLRAPPVVGDRSESGHLFSGCSLVGISFQFHCL